MSHPEEHASLDRLSLLRLAHIKVDRAILRHPKALSELELVAQIARDTLMQGAGPAARDVVIEGIDGTGEVTLQQIFNLGIKHIQGYITGEVDSPELRQLSPETRNKIASMVRGEAVTDGER